MVTFPGCLCLQDPAWDKDFFQEHPLFSTALVLLAMGGYVGLETEG